MQQYCQTVTQVRDIFVHKRQRLVVAERQTYKVNEPSFNNNLSNTNRLDNLSVNVCISS